MPVAAISSGAAMAQVNDSNRSAPLPAALTMVLPAEPASSASASASPDPARSAQAWVPLEKMPPPMVRKTAPPEAPRANPSRMVVESHRPNRTWKTMKHMESPSRLSPATVRPATPELRKATFRAEGLPSPAAAAARLFEADTMAMTATPAPSEQAAPRRKHNPDSHPRSLRSCLLY